jgi:hypothetical protein
LPVSRLQLWLQTSLVMAGKVRHLVNRSGRYHARFVVPKDLRGIVGKSELRAPLGGTTAKLLNFCLVQSRGFKTKSVKQSVNRGSSPIRRATLWRLTRWHMRTKRAAWRLMTNYATTGDMQ